MMTYAWTVKFITSFSYHLRLLNWQIGSLGSRIVVVSLNRALTILVGYWPLQLIGKASNAVAMDNVYLYKADYCLWIDVTTFHEQLITLYTDSF